jgi:disulfide bond formation protein DsbB
MRADPQVLRFMPRFLANSRTFYAIVFTVCAALIAFGLYLQHSKGLEPCPLCILQRVIFVAIGVVALVAALVGTRRPAARIGMGLAVALLALAGAGVAARQSWLQHFPPPIQECGADFYFLVDTTPLSKLLPALFSGTGDCAKRGWLFLNLSIAEWALVCFGAIAILALWRTFFAQTR